jgi:hypothetical protein
MVGPDRKSTGVLQPEALDWILTPRLKKFTLDFSIPDQHQASLDEFGEVEENWVRWIAESAIKRKWALQEIRLQFEPEWWDPAEHHFSEVRLSFDISSLCCFMD